MAQRNAAPLVRHVLEQFRPQQKTAVQAALALGLSRRRLDEWPHDYLKADARRQHAVWRSGGSGGDHGPAWPVELLARLRQRLGATPPAADSLAASAVQRRCGFRFDRAPVRRWALVHRLAPAGPIPRAPAAGRRWQRTPSGELWPMDATPHRWFAGGARL